MTVFGIDLAARHYRDIGIALLRARDQRCQVDFVRLAELGWRGPPTAPRLTEFMAELAEREGANVLALDGPQAWKAPDNGLLHARHCEKALHTQTKTGLPGETKPRTALRFAEFSLECFDCLAALGWSRLHTSADLQPGAKVALEVYPTAVWRVLGLKPLPAKAKSNAADVALWLKWLQQHRPLRLSCSPTHDELQATIAGLVGLAVAQDESTAYELHGAPLQQIEGTWREGYIVNLSSQQVRGAGVGDLVEKLAGSALTAWG